MGLKIHVITIALILGTIVGLSPVALATSNGQYKITYTSKLVSNNHVGNDWSIVPYVNSGKLNTSSTYSFNPTGKINLKSEVTEKDSKPDVGDSTLSVSLSALKVNQQKSYSTNVTVIENSGRYKGDKAVWSITYIVKRTK